MVPAAAAFRDTSRHQDGQEWVINLIEAIGKELPWGRNEEWNGLFEIGIGGTYKCTAGHLQQRRPEVLSMLSLGIVSMVTGQKLITTVEVLKNYFHQEEMEKHCDEEGCGAEHATVSSRITFHPQLLILQYKRFLGPGNKVEHPVQGFTDLNINGHMYGLVGLMVHQGKEMATGHYTSVTR
jgi:uncharacterized UBP type Zn finger protein